MVPALMVAVVPFALYLRGDFDGRWSTLPLFLLPVVGLAVAGHVYGRWRRRGGKRFGDYHDINMPGD